MATDIRIIVPTALGVFIPSMEYLEIFYDPVEDQNWESRGWYDGAESSGTLPLANDGAVPGSTKSIECAFATGATKGTNCSTFRLLFPPTNNIYLSYWVKYSTNWVGSAVGYHPHEWHFLTDIEDHNYWGLANTRLTVYVEQNSLVQRLDMQDSRNINQSELGSNLIGVIEARSVAGCNSGPVYDADQGGDCYISGGYRNN